jgi:prepilin-type N-terminal cleavage/methylation domain-containing protein
MNLFRSNRRLVGGFTLIELLVVISIMGLLASLTLMGFRHAQIQSSRNRTAAFHRAIMSGLESYHSDYGEYPEGEGLGEAMEFGKAKYFIGGSLMLYQALSGDGSSHIKLSTGGGVESNGRVENEELQRIKLAEMPKEMWLQTSKGYLLVDGFGRPFQYDLGPPKAGPDQALTANTTTVNSTYDLWSYAESETGTTLRSLSDKQDTAISGKWIKNW